jgi:hypothetical protein
VGQSLQHVSNDKLPFDGIAKQKALVVLPSIYATTTLQLDTDGIYGHYDVLIPEVCQACPPIRLRKEY